MKKYIVIRICNDDAGKPVAYTAPYNGRGVSVIPTKLLWM